MSIYWFEQTAADVPADNSWLSPAEQSRMDSLRIPKRRADWRLGRWTTKGAYAIHVGRACDPHFLAGVEVRPAASGAPELYVAGKLADVDISITHCAGRSACALAGRDIVFGCDMELIEPRSPEFIADYFTGGEKDFIGCALPEEKHVLATLFWSAKESALKALREGLRLDTRSVEVRLSDFLSESGSRWEKFEVLCTPADIFQGWYLVRNGLVRTIAGNACPSPPILLRSAAITTPIAC